MSGWPWWALLPALFGIIGIGGLGLASLVWEIIKGRETARGK